MGFLSKIFRKKKQQEESAEDWENVVYDRDEVNFGEQEQREGYITSCLEQIQEATREMNLLSGEYSLVTSYLMDMEEIEALPDEEQEKLKEIAGRLATLEQERARYRGKKNRMSDADYYRLRKHEDELQEGIDKLKQCEDYGERVKQDLKRLDRERHAYEYRRQELDTLMNNMRGMSVIFLTAFVLCVVMLLVLQFVFEMNARAGYLLAAASVAVAVTAVWVKYTDADSEQGKVDRAINKLIQLQNKVKIRYVNNRSLTDYLYMKYGTESASSLEGLWKQYQQEKEERREYAEAESKREFYQKELMGRMTNYRINSPERWLNQPGALLDKREMVEIRHDLILRRQALRKQMDYNSNVAETARKEIMDVADKYPAYAEDVQKLVDRFGGSGY